MAEILCEINATADSSNDASAGYYFQYNSRLPSSTVNIHVQRSTANMHITYSMSPTNVQLSATNMQCSSTTEVHMQCSTIEDGVQELTQYNSSQEEEGPSEPSALCTGRDVANSDKTQVSSLFVSGSL